VRTIHKYHLHIADIQTLHLPRGATVRHVDEQAGMLTLWAEVDPGEPSISRTLAIVGTGHRVPEEAQYIGSAVMTTGFVWHVYWWPL